MNPVRCSLAFVVLTSSPASAESFLEPFKHIHYSQRGTPFIHSFGIEPAFTGRDLFLDHSYREGNGVAEHETEVELEWALTSRIGVIIEVPYLWEDEEEVGSAAGLGDLAVVPRALLMEREGFLLTAQLEVVLPTGSNRFGGETAIAPGIAMWSDLGNWWTLNTSLAIEHAFNEDSTTLLFGFGFVKSFGERSGSHAEHDHASPAAGPLNLHLEAIGSTPVDDPDRGDINVEGLVGISYGFASGFDIRAGYRFPITSPTNVDKGFTAGVIFHF